MRIRRIHREPNVKETESTPDQKENQPDKQTQSIWQKAFAPETWSNWALVLITGGAVIAAFGTLGVITRQTKAAIQAGEIAEKTLLLTERADILIDAVPISNHPAFDCDSVVKIVFKNYGRTRGNRVEAKAELLIPGIELGGVSNPVPTPIIAAGNSLPVTFPPMREWVTQETVTKIKGGELTLRFDAEVSYFDVFDARHRTKCSGTFLPGLCSFIVDANQEAS